MLNYSLIPGSHTQIARSGDAFTIPSAGIVGVAAKPDPTDPCFMDLGTIETGEFTLGQSDHKLFGPAPGRLIMTDIKETMQELTCKFTVNTVNPLAIETFFRTSQKLGGQTVQKQFNPLTGPSRYCWLHAQIYDDQDGLFLTVDLWGKIRVNTFSLKSEPTKPEFDFFNLYSALATGLTS